MGIINKIIGTTHGEIKPPEPKPVFDRFQTLPGKLKTIFRERGLQYNLDYKKEVEYSRLWSMRAKRDLHLGFQNHAKAGDTFIVSGVKAYDFHMADAAEFIDADKYKAEEEEDKRRLAEVAQAEKVQGFIPHNPRRKSGFDVMAATRDE